MEILLQILFKQVFGQSAIVLKIRSTALESLTLLLHQFGRRSQLHSLQSSTASFDQFHSNLRLYSEDDCSRLTEQLHHLGLCPTTQTSRISHQLSRAAVGTQFQRQSISNLATLSIEKQEVNKRDGNRL